MNSIEKNIIILKKERGFHLITEEIINNLPEIETFHHGILNLFLLHTSGSLTINENTDHRVQKDLERYFTSLVPEKEHLYEHDDEGLDDMPAHIRSALTSTSEAVPVMNSKLSLGTWQGIYLWEHRDQPHNRKVMISIVGE